MLHVRLVQARLSKKIKKRETQQIDPSSTHQLPRPNLSYKETTSREDLYMVHIKKEIGSYKVFWREDRTVLSRQSIKEKHPSD
jgi:hypothetical protein